MERKVEGSVAAGCMGLVGEQSVKGMKFDAF